MRKYFIVDGYQRKGPFSVDELKKAGITPDTLIWTFETGKEIPASQIPEVNVIFIDNTDDEDAISDAEIIDQTIKNEQKTDDEQKKREEEILKQAEELLKNAEKQEKKVEKQKEEELSVKKQEENITQEEKPQKETEDDKNQVIPTPLPPQDNDKNENLGQKEQNTIEPEAEPELQQVEKIPETQEKEKKQPESENIFIGKKPKPPKPKNYLGWSLLTLFFCCNPLAIVTLFLSGQVEKKYSAGDYEGSQKISDTIKTLLIIGVVLVFGIIMLLIGMDEM